MKVLVIVTSSFGFDGISNVVKNYYTNLDHNIVSMDFIFDQIDDSFAKCVKANNNNFHIIKGRNRNTINYIIKTRNIVKKNKYDLIHIHGNSSTMLIELLASKLGGAKKRIAHCHTTKSNYPIIDKLLNPLMLRLTTHAFTCSQESGAWLFKNKLPFTLINNGINLSKFAFNQDVRSIYKSKYKLDGKFVVGHIGRFSYEKNHIKLLSIFEELCLSRKNSTLVLLGEGPLMAEIKQIATEKVLDVIFVGNTSDVAEWLQVFDCIIFPSLFEGIPLSLVEAQAAAVPCFISSTISPKVKLTDSIFFESIDASDKTWVEKIESINITDRLLKSKENCNLIKDNGYSIDHNCNKLLSLYINIINNK